MSALETDYRKKWRLRRRQMRLRRVPLVAAVVGVVLIAAMLSVAKRRPQLGAVAWARGDGSRGLPRIGLDGETLIVVWEDGVVTAHAPRSGKPVWPEPFERAYEFLGPPAVGKDRIVFGGTDCEVRCLELASGEPIWGYHAGAVVRSKPLIVEDRVFVGTDDGRLCALRLEDGTLDWVYPPFTEAAGRPILGGPAVAGDTLVCGSSDGAAFGLDIESGEPRWRIRVGSPVIAPVTTSDNMAYIPAERGRALCVRATDGRVVWTHRTSGLVRYPILVRRGRTYVLATDGAVSCLEATSGRILWRRKLDGRITTAGAADDAAIYLGTSRGVIVALDHRSGEIVWRWRPGVKPMGELLLGRAQLFCTTNNGRVFAVWLHRARG